ncbi:MAG: hypothetical protein LUH56_01130 [Oscillospiraceae bacterium]|nr:hypothetical protein [Oscillospiraceae bacterium]
MKRNHKLSKTLFAVALCAVMTTSAFAITVVDENGDRVYSTDVEGIANDTFVDLIESWSDADGNTVYPDYYAGAYFNGSELVVLVTELTDEVKAELSSIIDLEGITIKEATYSYNELLAANDEIVSKMNPNSEDPFIAAIYGVGIDQEENVVHVDLNTENPEVAAIAEDAELLAATVKEKLTDFEGVYVDATYGGIMALVEDTEASEGVDIATEDTDANAGIMLIDDLYDDAEEASNPATGVALALVPAAVAAAMAVVLKKRK